MKLHKKDAQIADLEGCVAFYKEKLENYQRLNDKKLRAYDAILGM
jgi:hypothetical protein